MDQGWIRNSQGAWQGAACAVYLTQPKDQDQLVP